MTKKVVCKPSKWTQDDLQLGKMTLGKEYEVFCEHGYLYQVMDDNGCKVWIDKDNFYVVEPKTPCPTDWKPADGYDITDYEAERLIESAFLNVGHVYSFIDIDKEGEVMIEGYDYWFVLNGFATPTLRAGAKPKQTEQIALNDEDVRAIAEGIDNPNPPSENLKDAKVKYQNFKDNEPDPVNHPSHYTDGGIETIDFIEAKQLDYYTGNAVKYISRAGKKDPSKEVQDLEKAVWYLKRKIERLKLAQDGQK